MVDPTRAQAVTGIQPPSPIDAPRAPASPSAGGARFQVLLEELELRAQEISRTSREPLSAEELPRAVQDARASLEGALELSASLLEAWRQSQAQAH